MPHTLLVLCLCASVHVMDTLLVCLVWLVGGTNVAVVLGESACTYFIAVVSQMKMDPFAEPAAT